MMNLSRIRAITASTLIGGVCLAACAPEMNWREVHPDEADGLVAWFPCKPTAMNQLMSWPGVSRVDVHVVSCRTGGTLWALRYVRLPNVNQIGPILRSWADEARTRQGYQASQMAALNVPGMTPQPDSQAWALTWMGPPPNREDWPTHAFAWHFSHGLTVFQASVWQGEPSENHTKGEDVVQTFKNGLHFPG